MIQVVKVDKNNIDYYIANKKILIARLRNSRIKCKQMAILELFQLLVEFDPVFPRNGPLGDIKGCIPMMISFCEAAQDDLLKKKLSGAGYTFEFYLLDFYNGAQEPVGLKSINPQKWKSKHFLIREFFKQDQGVFRSQAPDKRTFILLGLDGNTKEVKGYRGNGEEMGRRALPVEDCRFLFNLACNTNTTHLLDPFAGGGGIIYQARYILPKIYISSCDIAPELAPELFKYSNVHYVGKAKDFIPEAEYDALATEVPFSKSATPEICKSLSSLGRFMKKNCRIVIMCASEQVSAIRKTIIDMGCIVGNIFYLNRKGTEVRIILAFNNSISAKHFFSLWDEIKLIY